MPVLKAQLHTHTRQDPKHNINYSEKQLISYAASLEYEVLAITCHNVLIYSDYLEQYAQQKGILLIPGVEKEIEKKLVLILNAAVDAQNIGTFKELRTYKNKHPKCLIVAPHPFFWSGNSLRSKLIENIDLFDAIEDSYYCSKTIDWNKKAKHVAKEYDLPMIGTSNTHMLKYLDQGYSLINARGKTVDAVIEAIKKNQIEIVNKYLRLHNLLSIPMNIATRNLIKKALLLH